MNRWFMDGWFEDRWFFDGLAQGFYWMKGAWFLDGWFGTLWGQVAGPSTTIWTEV